MHRFESLVKPKRGGKKRSKSCMVKSRCAVALISFVLMIVMKSFSNKGEFEFILFSLMFLNCNIVL